MWNKTSKLSPVVLMGLVVAMLMGAVSTTSIQAQENSPESPAPIPGTDGVLIGADYWANKPMILSAGLGFEGIIGVDEINEETIL